MVTRRIAECVYDLMTIAYAIKPDLWDSDLDSRMFFDVVYDLAVKFEENYSDDDDYLTEIDEFGYRELEKFFEEVKDVYNLH